MGVGNLYPCIWRRIRHLTKWSSSPTLIAILSDFCPCEWLTITLASHSDPSTPVIINTLSLHGSWWHHLHDLTLNASIPLSFMSLYNSVIHKVPSSTPLHSRHTCVFLEWTVFVLVHQEYTPLTSPLSPNPSVFCLGFLPSLTSLGLMVYLLSYCPYINYGRSTSDPVVKVFKILYSCTCCFCSFVLSS